MQTHSWVIPKNKVKKTVKAQARSVKRVVPELSGFGEDDGNMGFSLKVPKIKVKIKKPKITVKKVIPKITINTKTPLKTLSHAGGDAWRIVNPVNQMHAVIDKVPMLKQLHKETDKVLGGTLSSLDRISNLPYKALKGKPISSGEIMEAVVMAVKVGAIVASGGSAVALIAAGAGMLKAGPLGKTSFGRNLLTLVEVAGVASAIYSAGASQLATQGATQAGATAGATATGQATAMTATQAGQKAVEQHVANVVKSKLEEEFEKKTGIPVTVATKIYNVASGDAKLATLPKDIAKEVATKVMKKSGLGPEMTKAIMEGRAPEMSKVAEEQLKKAGLGDTVTQAILSNNASQLGVLIKDAPNLALSKAERQLKAEAIRAEKYLSVENLRKIAKEKADKAIADATNMQKLKEKLDKEKDKLIKAELEKQFNKLVISYGKSQQESVDAVREAELEGARASILIASAEEGRYASQTNVPMIAGAIGLTAIAGYFLYNSFGETV